jgi:hypothetical protein
LGSAYTPGLTVSADVVVRRVRRLPIKGEVLLRSGDPVRHDQVLARALLPGLLQTIKLPEKLGLEPKEAVEHFTFKVGDPIEKGQLVAETKGFFGLFRTHLYSDYTGTVESVSEITGSVLLREPPIPVEITGYLDGQVVEVMEDEGAVVEARGAMVQGIFGIGGERNGEIRVAVESPGEVLDAPHIQEPDAGKVLVGGACVTFEAIQKAAETGVVGLVSGGVRDYDLTQFLGYDIGVAITGQEAIGITLIVTEGFGVLGMAERTFKLLKSVEGRSASINGATQIRAGVIRPELVVPLEMAGSAPPAAGKGQELAIGTPIRVIREPYFGRLGTVTELPAQLSVVESGTEVRVLKARLEDGDEVCVPRANVEIIAT